MGDMIRVKAQDGFEFETYRTAPDGQPRGGLVLIQEIFGVNGHIRGVADKFAAEGYFVIAPALFDRVERGVQFGYSQDDIKRGSEIKSKTDTGNTLMDIEAARNEASKAGKVGVAGYCWGGLLAWLSATRLSGIAGTVSYYGGGIGTVADEKPKCPALLHFGEQDHAIPLSDVEKLKGAQGDAVEIHLYPAGHGFNCDERPSYSPESAARAQERTIAFLRKWLG